jgi:predicted  nucleic acid-binding Zn-ribbon protein
MPGRSQMCRKIGECRKGELRLIKILKSVLEFAPQCGSRKFQRRAEKIEFQEVRTRNSSLARTAPAQGDKRDAYNGKNNVVNVLRSLGSGWVGKKSS